MDAALVSDIIGIANRTPLAAISRDLDLSLLNRYRRFTRPRISWNVMMMKAYGIVAARNPILRRMYVGFPWPHLYEHDQSVCMLTVARHFRGEERLFFARFGQPNLQSLVQLQTQYEHFRRAPVESIPQFRHQIRFAAAPWILRKLGWWTLFNLWPQKRATHAGTFGMSLSKYKEAIGSFHLGPCTSILGIDGHPRRGQSRILLTFDHRVIDGKPATDVLEDLKRALQTAITHETKRILRNSGQDPDVIRQGGGSHAA